jgi:hypothetical protein
MSTPPPLSGVLQYKHLGPESDTQRVPEGGRTTTVQNLLWPHKFLSAMLIGVEVIILTWRSGCVPAIAFMINRLCSIRKIDMLKGYSCEDMAYWKNKVAL